jgi:hypothetical protein
MERQFLDLKLKCLLPTDVYKVADVLFACQKDGYITFSPQNAKSMHMPQEAVELCIQTLLDREILTNAVKEGKYYKFQINADMLKRYRESSWDAINDAPILAKANEVRYTQEKPSGLTAEQMMAEIKSLQLMLAEKMKENTSIGEGLPY